MKFDYIFAATMCLAFSFCAGVSIAHHQWLLAPIAFMGALYCLAALMRSK